MVFGRVCILSFGVYFAFFGTYIASLVSCVCLSEMFELKIYRERIPEAAHRMNALLVSSLDAIASSGPSYIT